MNRPWEEHIIRREEEKLDKLLDKLLGKNTTTLEMLEARVKHLENELGELRGTYNREVAMNISLRRDLLDSRGRYWKAHDDRADLRLAAELSRAECERLRETPGLEDT